MCLWGYVNKNKFGNSYRISPIFDVVWLTKILFLGQYTKHVGRCMRKYVCVNEQDRHMYRCSYEKYQNGIVITLKWGVRDIQTLWYIFVPIEDLCLNNHVYNNTVCFEQIVVDKDGIHKTIIFLLEIPSEKGYIV